MNHTTPLLHTAAALVASATLAFSQGGPLTPPPGAPAPTMKSLDQVEPRIPLVAGAPGVSIGASGTITISLPGSYYLTGNLQITGNASGISISASGVSIDLMGHSIIAPASGDAGSAIFVSSNANNIRIQNGHILSTTTFAGNTFTPSGFFNGIRAPFSANHNVSISDVTVHGCRSDGILVSGQGSIVGNCSVFISGVIGISNPNGTVVDSVVHTTGSTGINASVVSNCRVNNSLGTGINAATVSNSYARSISSASSGISATTVNNSVGITSGQHGISATTVSYSRGQSTNTSSGNHGVTAVPGQVSGSSGLASGGHGVRAYSVSNSVGISTGANDSSSSGISADRVSGSQGSANNASGGQGIYAQYGVSASYGSSNGLQGIYAPSGMISDSYGSSNGNKTSSQGIRATIVTNSRGYSTNATGGEGIRANDLAMNSSGISWGSHGISTFGAATGCYGSTNHTAASSHGIRSEGLVTSSYGWSIGSGGGDGINASVVTGSFGKANPGARHGVVCTILESSYGQRGSSVAGKFGIAAERASLSLGINGENIINRYNMP